MRIINLMFLIIAVLALSSRPALADAIPDTIVRAAYCKGVVTEQLKVMRPDVPNGIDGKPMLAADGKLILPELANNPNYPLPNSDYLAKKIAKYEQDIHDYQIESENNKSFIDMLFMAGVNDFDSHSILNAAQCKSWPTKDKKDICIQLTAPNADKVADCIKSPYSPHLN